MEPDSPAARAVDGYPTSELQSIQELASCASGDADSELELQLERSGVAQPLRVRMRRITDPAKAPPPLITGPSGFQASIHANRLTNRWSRKRAALRLAFDMATTFPMHASLSFARRSSALSR